MDAIQKIEEALAAGPTEGPWDASDWTEDDGPACTTIAASRPEVLRPGQTSIWRNGIVKIQVANTNDGESPLIDAAYIAACNPSAIREVLQTLASKEAELVRVRDALAWSEQLNRRPGEGHNECFERIAKVFYRQTGHMRPGKDASPESGVSMDERQAAWDAWIAEGIAKMRAALKQPTE